MTPKELTKIRESMGLNQSELAKVLQVDKATISRWESGKSKIGRFEAQAIRIVAMQAA